MNLIDKINQASDYIAKAGRNSSANYMIVSHKLAEIIENLDIKKHRKKKLQAIELKNKLENMKVITLCGSTKFKNEFQLVNKWLTLQGNIVITVSMFGHIDKEPLNRNEKILLDEVHKRKIDLASEIFVVDVDNYIGESTKKEIEYATSKGKAIRYFSNEKSLFDQWNKVFYNRTELEDWNENPDFKGFNYTGLQG